MALSLACACGTRFEVEETFAGQVVTCPECHRTVKAPVASKVPLRTSGYALASIVVALVLAFTVVGPALAVVLGLIGLVSISRNRHRVAGTGYAVCGIVLGLVFTGLSLLAFTNVEVFQEARERLLENQVDRNGPMEIVVEKDGFAITRPSRRWGVAAAQLLQRVQPGGSLALVNVSQDAYLTVSMERVGGMTVDQCRESVLAGLRQTAQDDAPAPRRSGGAGPTGYRLRETRRLPPLEHARVEEAVVDLKIWGQAFTFLFRFLKDEPTGRLFTLRAWVLQRHFARVRPDFEKAMDSFRLLDQHP